MQNMKLLFLFIVYISSSNVLSQNIDCNKILYGPEQFEGLSFSNRLLTEDVSYTLATKEIIIKSAFFKTVFNKRELGLSFQLTKDNFLVIFFRTGHYSNLTKELTLANGQRISFTFANGEKLSLKFNGKPSSYHDWSVLSGSYTEKLNAIKLDRKNTKSFLSADITNLTIYKPFEKSKPDKEYIVKIGKPKQNKIKKYFNCLSNAIKY